MREGLERLKKREDVGKCMITRFITTLKKWKKSKDDDLTTILEKVFSFNW